MRATVLVLGDLGRSPRMANHARALAAAGYLVDFVGYAGAPLPSTVRRVVAETRIAPVSGAGARGLLGYAAKALLLLLRVGRALLAVPRADVVVLQVPPSIPALVLALFVKYARGSALVVDWHNFGHTLMAAHVAARRARDARHFVRLLRGDATRAPAVRLAQAHDAWLGRLADGHLCVTRAMRDAIAGPAYFNWTAAAKHPPAAVVMDRPGPPFALADDDARACHALTAPGGRLADVLRAPGAPDWLARGYAAGDAPFTERDGAAWRGAGDRPALVVTATSWTVDEDLGMLLDACERYAARRAAAPATLPRLAVVVTGKGEGRAAFVAALARRHAENGRLGDHVAVRVAYLEDYADYARLVGIADAGVSLHVSSSGIDLPMKAVDMLGCGVPVLALSYPCLAEEMVRDGDNGRLFDDAAGLAGRLADVFGDGFPWTRAGTPRYGAGALPPLRRGARGWARGSWSDEWEEKALPVIREAVSRAAARR